MSEWDGVCECCLQPALDRHKGFQFCKKKEINRKSCKEQIHGFYCLFIFRGLFDKLAGRTLRVTIFPRPEILPCMSGDGDGARGPQKQNKKKSNMLSANSLPWQSGSLPRQTQQVPCRSNSKAPDHDLSEAWVRYSRFK